MDPWDALGDSLARMERRIRELESRLDETDRMARNARDDVSRLEDRMRYLEEAAR